MLSPTQTEPFSTTSTTSRGRWQRLEAVTDQGSRGRSAGVQLGGGKAGRLRLWVRIIEVLAYLQHGSYTGPGYEVRCSLQATWGGHVRLLSSLAHATAVPQQLVQGCSGGLHLRAGSGHRQPGPSGEGRRLQSFLRQLQS